MRYKVITAVTLQQDL